MTKRMISMGSLLLPALLSLGCPASAPKHGVVLRFEPAEAGADLNAIRAVLARRMKGVEGRGIEVTAAADTGITIKVPGGVYLDTVKRLSMQPGRLGFHPVDDKATVFLKTLRAQPAAPPADVEAKPAETPPADEGEAGGSVAPADGLPALPRGVEVTEDRYQNPNGSAQTHYYLESGRLKTLEELIVALKATTPAGRRFEVTEHPGATPAASVWRSLLVVEDGWDASLHISAAAIIDDPASGKPRVSISFSPAGAKAFEQLTAENVGRRIAIILDGRVDSAPVVQEKIAGGKAQLLVAGETRREQLQQAQSMAAVLGGGPLPTKLKLVEEKAYGETKSIGAGGI